MTIFTIQGLRDLCEDPGPWVPLSARGQERRLRWSPETDNVLLWPWRVLRVSVLYHPLLLIEEKLPKICLKTLKLYTWFSWLITWRVTGAGAEHNVFHLLIPILPESHALLVQWFGKLVIFDNHPNLNPDLSDELSNIPLINSPETISILDPHLIISYFSGFNTEVAMRKAMENVEKHYAVVGVLEDLNKTLTVLEHYIPRFFKGAKDVYYSKCVI